MLKIDTTQSSNSGLLLNKLVLSFILILSSSSLKISIMRTWFSLLFVTVKNVDILKLLNVAGAGIYPSIFDVRHPARKTQSSK